MTGKTNKPIAVLISDIHYNIQTLEVADKALRMAVDKANILGVPLIIAGDLHDTKANIRGECIRSLVETLKLCRIIPYILRGNHDSLNEKSKIHSLGFLDDADLAIVINDGGYARGLHFIPYYDNPDDLRIALKSIPKGSTLIMHQGVQDTEAGHYFMDKSSILKQDLIGFRVISGHYHTRQSFALPEGGRFDYLGNPFTLGFGESTDLPKGFQVLYDDGSLEFVPTNLRRHVILNAEIKTDGELELPSADHVGVADIVWMKLTGPTDKLQKYSKESLGKFLNLQQTFRLDLIPTDTKTEKQEESQNISQAQILDNLIDSLTNTDDNRKARLKELWKNLKG